MEIKPIRTKADHRAALKEIEGLMSARPSTRAGERLDVLAALVEAWEKKRYPMAKESYTDEPLGKLKVVANFLPAPKDLMSRVEDVKVTLTLSKRSVEFFKREAAKHHTQYQRMIRRLLDAYAEHHAQRPIDSGTGHAGSAASGSRRRRSP
jgi:predicted DNA binding CopG/RHH family protein